MVLKLQERYFGVIRRLPWGEKANVNLPSVVFQFLKFF